MTVHVFGIRHHGPGCARALAGALAELQPDLVLVEGPSDASDALALLAHEGFVPPIALLVYALDDPRQSSFYPFAEFSPEWQALRYATAQRIPTRFVDLPCTHSLALRAREAELHAQPERGAGGDSEESARACESDLRSRAEEPRASTPRDERLEEHAEESLLREDPIGLLAEAAGYADHEQWWDVQVEQRVHAAGLFEGILEAMTALREQHPETRESELQREAFMRVQLREAQTEGFQRIAVVCGAWHAPALSTVGPAKPDQERLRGLPKTKVASTWIPWTHSRLSFRSGYGAGVDSPGWYAHVYRHRERAPAVWATLAARLLRAEDLDASAANVIETVRLASTLAALRELPRPGLGELRDAIGAVLTGGDGARLALIRQRLEIGEALGQVPEQAGQVPLARDFERELKRLRLKLSAEHTPLELDLRNDTDRERSQLLHRLHVLAVDWGRLSTSGANLRSRAQGRASTGAGTFRESWLLAWRPELMVALIAANLHGNSVSLAATRALDERARSADLKALTGMVEVALLAHLPDAVDPLLRELDARAASSSDIGVQLLAVSPLARVARYGDVRGSHAELVLPVLKALFERIVVGLPPACSQLDDDAAGALLVGIGQAHDACLLLALDELEADWLGALRKLADTSTVHPRVRGRACRLLLGQRSLSESELATHASLALSVGVEPADAARWVEGLVEGEGLLLVHQEELLRALDGWVAALSDEVFQAQLPLLRRAFSAFSPAERRAVAQAVKTASRAGGVAKARPATQLELDPARAERVLPVLAQVLGVSHG